MAPTSTFTAFVQNGLLALWLLVSWCQAEPNEITLVKQEDRRIELSVPCPDHPVPGPYRLDMVLPEDYDQSSKSYAVLYVFDGTDISATLDALVQEDLASPAILVAIHNRTYPARIYDMTPAPISECRVASGGIAEFRNLIIEQIQPYLAQHYRVLPGPEHTGAIGNSLSGLAALWLGYVYPKDFGLIGGMEPSLWWADNLLLKKMQHETTGKTNTRFWIMAAEKKYPGMWRSAKRAAYALNQRGWQEGDDLAFYQVHNGSHGRDSCNSQMRDMLAFLLGPHPWQLIDISLTNCHGIQHQPFVLEQLGELANAYLDLEFARGFRSTAINPDLQIANPQVAQFYDVVTGQLIPVGPGWTTVTARYQGLQARLTVQGFSFGSYQRLPLSQVTSTPVIDGDLSDWSALPYTIAENDDSSAGFAFGITHDANFVYLGINCTDDTWISQESFPDSLKQDGLEIQLDARPDPIRSLNRGKERYFDFLTLQMTPGETADTMKIRQRKDGFPVLPEGLQAVCLRTTTGFQAEVAIPCSALDERQGQVWQELRLNLCQIDVDDANVPPRRLWWQPDWESDKHIIGSGTFKR